MVRGLFNKYEYSYEPARIYKAMDKGRRGEDLKIGVIGGSITQGFFASTEQKRWANLMADWWKETFPNSNVTLINAGWGGTGSDIGVHRVYDDLLVQNPDFIVIEFAVNDAEGELATKMMEGLVQQIILNENAPGIMVLALKQENGTTAQASHKKVTDYYHIPLVSFADSIDARVAADGLTLHDIYEDGIHPNDIGMQYMADFIIEQLDTLYANLPAANALPPVNTNLPAPLVTDTYAHTFQFFPDNIIPISNPGWDIADNGWSTSTPGNQIDFQVMGNAFSLVFTQNIGSERGRAEVWVDEGQKTVIDAFMNEDWGTRYAFSLIQEGLDDGEHILHIRCMNETSTSGNFVQITRILVAGNIGSAAPIALTSGYQKGVVGNELLLDGTQSYDPDGEAIDAFSWTITEKPANSTTAIGNAASSIATFTPDVAGTYKISLVVSSGINASVPFIKTLDVRATNSIPVAVAGNDTLSALGKYFRFDGTKSYDADGDILTYQWTMESAPETSTAELMGVTYAKPQIKFDVEGDFTFSLVVFDSIDYSEKSYIKVTAKEGYTKIQDKTENPGNIMIYPNPTRDKITIDFNQVHASITAVTVFSILGTSVYQVLPSTEENLNSVLSINLNEKVAKKGIYLVKISTAQKQYVQRITLL